MCCVILPFPLRVLSLSLSLSFVERSCVVEDHSHRRLPLPRICSIGEDKFKLNTGIPYPEFNITTARQVMPLSIIYVGLITLTNYCLRNVEISFYQLVKSLTIVSTAASIVAWVSRCSHTTHTHSLSLSLSLVR
eukprot:TRINITY_DN1683_c1_g1_i1.p1 TRINITY_DN1683_c1_g1~~TRINITY_DN1683_c1_g1_i1.p1  ORF type:complete len:134 (-),score=26.51 TRINITY_DN1683_c1_g1_i1:83-484(-)